MPMPHLETLYEAVLTVVKLLQVEITALETTAMLIDTEIGATMGQLATGQVEEKLLCQLEITTTVLA